MPNKAKYETETSKAVLQIVNARKLYPKALTMRYENEEKFAKKQLRKKAVEANRESRKKAERRGSAVSISADVDQTLSYGDWKILEPGNFGSQVSNAFGGIPAHVIFSRISPPMDPVARCQR